MIKNKYRDLDDLHWDILKEVSNVGTGNALSALSNFLDNSVKLNQPYIRMLDYDEVMDKLGGSDTVVTGLLLFLSGDIDGMIMFLLHENFTLEALQLLLGYEIPDLYSIDEIGISALRELSNIMASSYVNAISSLGNMAIQVSVPSIAIDMVGSIMSVPTIHFADISNRVLFMENDFTLGGENVSSSILLFAKDESVKKMIHNLEMGLQ